MKINLRFFASLREALGSNEVLELAAPLTLAELRDLLIARGGKHAEVLARNRAVRCALNQVMSAETELIAEDAEVAFFPPVTGG